MNLLITGGCGFIGSNLIHYILNKKSTYVKKIVNFDCLSYASDLKNVEELKKNPKYVFIEGDLKNFTDISKAIDENNITHIIHLAAETHVDNSILDADAFLSANVLGTHNLLKAALKFKIQRFHHVSTDEVYGHLNVGDKKFSESTPYDPRNPYSASKAASDEMFDNH